MVESRKSHKNPHKPGLIGWCACCCLSPIRRQFSFRRDRGMRVRGWIAALALGALVMAPSAAWAQTSTAAKVDDGTIKTRVETRLKNTPSLKNDNIDVAVDNGVVTLTGTVHSEAQSVRARQLAKVAGVTRVENKLEVSKAEGPMEKAGAKADKTMDKAGAKTKTAGEKTKDAAVKVGEKTKDVAATTGEADRKST